MVKVRLLFEYNHPALSFQGTSYNGKILVRARLFEKKSSIQIGKESLKEFRFMNPASLQDGAILFRPTGSAYSDLCFRIIQFVQVYRYFILLNNGTFFFIIVLVPPIIITVATGYCGKKDSEKNKNSCADTKLLEP